MEIDISQFCARGSPTRYPVTGTPFRSKWLYATDGRVCVRVPKSHVRVPPVGDLFDDFDPGLCTEPWPQHNGRIAWRKVVRSRSPQFPEGIRIDGEVFLRIASLGSVYYRLVGDRLHFRCRDLQGVVMTLPPIKTGEAGEVVLSIYG